MIVELKDLESREEKMMRIRKEVQQRIEHAKQIMAEFNNINQFNQKPCRIINLETGEEKIVTSVEKLAVNLE